jgi:hypothetical protein
VQISVLGGHQGGQIRPAKETRLNCTSAENLSLLTDRLPARWKSVLRRRRLSDRTVQAAPATEIARLRTVQACICGCLNVTTKASVSMRGILSKVTGTGYAWLPWCLQGRIRLLSDRRGPPH